jgi:transposase
MESLSPQHRIAHETRGRRTRLSGEVLRSIKEWVASDPQLTLEDIQGRLHDAHSIQVGLSTVGRWLRLAGFTRKRVSYCNSEALLPRVQIKRRDFLARVKRGQGTGWKTFVNVDECSWNLHQTGSYAWSVKGTPAIITRPAARGQRFTLTLAVGVREQACVAWCLQQNSATGASFRDFLQTLPCPTGTVVVLDNARIHHATKSLTTQGLTTIAETAKDNDLELLYLPPYSPELAPVEMVFSTLRTFVRARAPRTEAHLRAAIQRYVQTMTVAKMQNLFRHARRQSFEILEFKL